MPRLIKSQENLQQYPLELIEKKNKLLREINNEKTMNESKENEG